MSYAHVVPPMSGGAADPTAANQAQAAMDAAARIAAAAAAAAGPAAVAAAPVVEPRFDPNPTGGSQTHGPNAAMCAFANEMLRALPTWNRVVRNLPDAQMNAAERDLAMAQFTDFTRVATVLRHDAYQSDQRVQNEAITPIVTRVKLDGTVNAMPDLRQYKMPDFTGVVGETTVCLNWLSRLMRMAEEENLTQAAARKLLERHSTGKASDLITEAIRLDTPLITLIRTLEVRFASLSHPDQARETCNNLTRNKGETIGELAARIHRHAFMACRLDKHTRAENEQALSRDNFLRCLYPDVRSTLQQTISTRAFSGLPSMTLTDLIAEAEKIEVNQKAFRRNGNGASASAVAFHVAQDDSDHYWERVNYVRDDRHRSNAGNNRRDGNGRQGRSRERPSNGSSNPRPPTPYGRSQSRSPGRDRARSASGNRRTIDLAALNVQPGQCAKCGLQGHRFTSTECPLYLVNIMQSPCTSCKTGGHLPLCCPARRSKN